MNFVLDTLSDQELETLIRESNCMPVYLDLIKHNTKKYAQFTPLLGNMKSNSLLVKKNLPSVVIKLFRRKDQAFVKAFEDLADGQANSLLQCIEETTGKECNAGVIEAYSDEEFADIIVQFAKGDDPSSQLSFDLLWVQLKLNGISINDERKNHILKLCAQSDVGSVDKLKEKSNSDVLEKDNQSILNDIEIVKEINTVRKPKAKKLTAEEKAEKNRIALANKAKEKESQEYIEEIKNVKKQTVQPPVDLIIDRQADSASLKQSKTANAPSIYKESGEKDMYIIGRINIIGSFFNLTPIGRYEDGMYSSFSENEINALLPKSQKNNINFYYSIWDKSQVDFMYSRFHDNELAVLNCEIDQLDENRKSDGQLNETGYKISALEGCNTDKILRLSDLGLSKLISLDDLDDDINSKRTIRLRGDSFVEDESVLVNLGERFYAGPYRIKYSSINDCYFITTQDSKNSGYLIGFSSTACQRVLIDTSLDNWTQEYSENYYYVKAGESPIYKDLMTDKDVIQAFIDSLEKDTLSNINASNVDSVVENISDSKLLGISLPEEVREKRVHRLKDVFETDRELDNVISETSELVYKMLLRGKDVEKTSELLSSIIEAHPEFLDKIQGIRIVQSRLDQAKQELAEVEAKATEIKTDQTDNDKKVVSELSNEIESKKAELEEISKKLEIVDSASKLNDKVNGLHEQEKYLEQHIQNLRSDTKNLEHGFIELINSYSEKMADITFDGFMSSKMLESAAEWQRKEEHNALADTVAKVNSLEDSISSKDELIQYIVDTVQIARPKYDRNTILNISICSMQGFLTVFSGTPGCGKTSICNIFAKVLGLTDYSSQDSSLKGVQRYIPVSVERGWTSKRDFVGYFNPLTKSFEESNRDVFRGLKLLDEEQKIGSSKFPYFILLDEANLSPMEYYWADFMNVCDERNSNSFINLGNENVFSIPETLHFLATINNDHTTETLSPRLIDRAWVITLPKVNAFIRGGEIPDDIIKHLSWADLKKVFIETVDKTDFDREVSSIIDGIKERLSNQGIYISPRVNMAIFDYWKVASTIMVEDEYDNQPNIIAIDYAIAQKVLPKISGSGDEYESWLNELKDYLNSKNLLHSSEIIEGIIDRGSSRMKYYDFFN